METTSNVHNSLEKIEVTHSLKFLSRTLIMNVFELQPSNVLKEKGAIYWFNSGVWVE